MKHTKWSLEFDVLMLVLLVIVFSVGYIASYDTTWIAAGIFVMGLSIVKKEGEYK